MAALGGAPVRRGEGGFSLVEVMLTMVIAVLVVLMLHAVLESSMKGRVAAERQAEIQSMAEEYLARLREIPFGRPTDPPPAGSMLTELFDDDQDLGTITLHQVAVPADQPGHVFGVSRDGVVGAWRIKVSDDLDRNGDNLGPREGRSDLLGIEIYFEDRLVLSTLRADEPAFTSPDTGVVYIK